jgi:hypothetical protein
MSQSSKLMIQIMRLGYSKEGKLLKISKQNFQLSKIKKQKKIVIKRMRIKSGIKIKCNNIIRDEIEK